MKALSIRLSILGLLLEENLHPYEISLRMKERFLDQKGQFKIGSLYYAVDQLEKQSYIEAVETIRSENRPDKTVFRITDKGRTYFHKLLIERLRDTEPPYHPMYIALVFAGKGDQLDIAQVLKERIQDTEHMVNIYYQVYAEHRGIVPRSVLHLMVGQYEHAKTELSWLKRLLAETEEGRLNERTISPLLDEEYEEVRIDE
ncbi:Transcriptional regulator PadR-like family protein [Fontibacillus panacisegetis]|uniref:Transcriptional regulator PadR-like family protein n=1 Tax=Fontibacillus panacisegetis TaxID=670482 RepID=A0A1G7Q2N1_9BACL|nr:PadR family transcriptional regulator [Fontibacillus panacisegetis]SDF91870.1 Transcriptional regulator PadR-like family protein [Fontibacillus panacisegetis]